MSLAEFGPLAADLCIKVLITALFYMKHFKIYFVILLALEGATFGYNLFIILETIILYFHTIHSQSEGKLSIRVFINDKQAYNFNFYIKQDLAQIQVQIAGQIDVLYWNLFFVALSFFAVGNQIPVKKSGLKWTVLGQSGSSKGVQLDGPND